MPWQAQCRPLDLFDVMRCTLREAFVYLGTIFMICTPCAQTQNVPTTSAKPWHSDREEQFAKQLQGIPDKGYAFDASHTYTLAELVNLAESHNPDTRVAWQTAKARAQSVGIAQSALFPTITAIALTRTLRQNDIYAGGFYRDTLGLFQPVLDVNYLIFDFGRRSGAIGIGLEIGPGLAGEKALGGLGFGVDQEDAALFAHAAGHQPFAAPDLDQVFRLIQPADETKSHGGRASSRALGRGMGHACRLLG